MITSKYLLKKVLIPSAWPESLQHILPHANYDTLEIYHRVSLRGMRIGMNWYRAAVCKSTISPLSSGTGLQLD